ncbi:hypothetical protein CKAH01_11111 [Colletotrichum kahawae]|uniref:Uncharacterized protein n=1 Tax=Colletotrichum kahawae TaxID=34407 RepID=A0AAD9XUV2_COLKA|nr:hypothetical protein CKAH01_11111 [Colletotrichum kahawae]
MPLHSSLFVKLPYLNVLIYGSPRQYEGRSGRFQHQLEVHLLDFLWLTGSHARLPQKWLEVDATLKAIASISKSRLSAKADLNETSKILKQLREAITYCASKEGGVSPSSSIRKRFQAATDRSINCISGIDALLADYKHNRIQWNEDGRTQMARLWQAIKTSKSDWGRITKKLKGKSRQMEQTTKKLDTKATTKQGPLKEKGIPTRKSNSASGSQRKKPATNHKSAKVISPKGNSKPAAKPAGSQRRTRWNISYEPSRALSDLEISWSGVRSEFTPSDNYQYVPVYSSHGFISHARRSSPSAARDSVRAAIARILKNSPVIFVGET